MMNKILLFACLSFLTIFTLTHVTHAQGNDDVIFPDSTSGEKNSSETPPKTSKDYAIDYYNTCMGREHSVYTKDQQKTLCTCAAAKMIETVDINDLKIMNEKTREGQKARTQFIIGAYAPCMPYIIKDIAYGDCKRTKAIKGLVKGKNLVCQCAVKNIEDVVKRIMPHQIVNIIKYNPMTLDPMEYYFNSEDYARQIEPMVNSCIYENRYEQEN